MKKIFNKLLALFSALAFPAALIATATLFGYFYSISDHIPTHTSSLESKVVKEKNKTSPSTIKKTEEEGILTVIDDKVKSTFETSNLEKPKSASLEELNIASQTKENSQNKKSVENRLVPLEKDTNYPEKETAPVKPSLDTSDKETNNEKAIKIESEDIGYSKDIERLLKLGTPIPIEAFK